MQCLPSHRTKNHHFYKDNITPKIRRVIFINFELTDIVFVSFNHKGMNILSKLYFLIRHIFFSNYSTQIASGDSILTKVQGSITHTLLFNIAPE